MNNWSLSMGIHIIRLTRHFYNSRSYPFSWQNCGLGMRREYRERSRHVRDARAIMHVCIVNQQWRSRHSRRMHNPQFYVSGKRLMASPSHQQTWHWLHGCGTFMSFATTITSSTYYWYTVFFLHYDYVHTGLTWQRIGPTLIHLAVSAVIIIHLTANNNQFGYFVNGIMTRYLNIAMICTGYITQWLRIPLHL